MSTCCCHRPDRDCCKCRQGQTFTQATTPIVETTLYINGAEIGTCKSIDCENSPVLGIDGFYHAGRKAKLKIEGFEWKK